MDASRDSAVEQGGSDPAERGGARLWDPGELARQLARTWERAAAEELICRAAAAGAGAEDALLLRLEPDAESARLVASAAGGHHGGEEPRLCGAGALESVLRFGASLALERTSEALAGGFAANAGRPMLIHPLAGEQALLVVLWSERGAEVPAGAGRRVAAVAEEAAVALANVSRCEQLAELARVDPLTGALNRRAWEEDLDREIARAEREGTRLTVALLDLDRLERFNDRHGHQAGDRLLAGAAERWRHVLRPTAVLARYGGDEFAVALAGCDQLAAAAVAARLRRAVPGEVSCTIGLAEWGPGVDAASLVAAAERALMLEKAARGSQRDRAAIDAAA